LVIKNFKALGEQQAYPTELDQFKWHLHADRTHFAKGVVLLFKLIAEPLRYFRGDYEIAYE
jgi:hypothetical protein